MFSALIQGGQAPERAAPHIDGAATRRKTGTPARLHDKRIEGFRRPNEPLLIGASSVATA
jgi:hypothetical protein